MFELFPFVQVLRQGSLDKHKFENLCYTLEEKKKWEVKNELQVTNFELGISIPAVPDGGGKSLNREIS